MLSREELYHRILKLVPDANFNYFPDDQNSERDLSIEDDTFSYIKMGGWVIGWHKNNAQSCPKLSEIEAVTINVPVEIEVKRKEFRDSEKAKDISLVASFNIEKKSNPALEFSAYLDSLEQKSKDMQDAVAAKVN